MIKTKPFNLSEALAGARVVTRDGREVTQLHRFDVQQAGRLIGAVDGVVGRHLWEDSGIVWTGHGDEDDLFLLDEPKKITLYGYVVFKKGELTSRAVRDTQLCRDKEVGDIREHGDGYVVVTFEHEVEVPGERE